jgi:hypothetical protein
MTSCPGCGCAKPTINDEQLDPQDDGSYLAAIIGSGTVTLTNDTDGHVLQLSLDDVSIVPHDGECEEQNTACVPKTSCAFDVTVELSASLNANTGYLPNITLEMPSLNGIRQTCTPTHVNSGGPNSSSCNYEATATVKPGCGASKQFSFTMLDMDIRATGWTTSDPSTNTVTSGTLQCAVCGTQPPG